MYANQHEVSASWQHKIKQILSHPWIRLTARKSCLIIKSLLQQSGYIIIETTKTWTGEVYPKTASVSPHNIFVTYCTKFSTALHKPDKADLHLYIKFINTYYTHGSIPVVWRKEYPLCMLLLRLSADLAKILVYASCAKSNLP